MQLRAGVNALASPLRLFLRSSMAYLLRGRFLLHLPSTDERYVKLQNKRICRYTTVHSRRKYTGF